MTDQMSVRCSNCDQSFALKWYEAILEPDSATIRFTNREVVDLINHSDSCNRGAQ